MTTAAAFGVLEAVTFTLGLQDVAAMREAVQRGSGDALRRCIREEDSDQSNQPIIARIHQFLDFALEQAERSQTRIELGLDEFDDEANDPLHELLRNVSIFSRSRRRVNIDHDESNENDEDDGSYRVVPLDRAAAARD